MAEEAPTKLARGLSKRHVTVIAIGGTIGTGSSINEYNLTVFWMNSCLHDYLLIALLSLEAESVFITKPF